ncbi:IS3 family transposase, partial [Rhodococcus erythropolis]
MLQIAHLPKSTFYDHRNRLRRADRHAELKGAIRKTFEDAKGAYGHRRILAILRRQGRRVSKKTVLTLMRTLGLQCLVRRRKRYNSFRGEVGEAAENVLNRQFAAETAHTKWATDVTEFNIGSSKVYLSPILDLHDNRIISVTAGPSPSVKMVTDSLRMAIDTLSAGEKPLVHSDSETVRAGVFGFPDRYRMETRECWCREFPVFLTLTPIDDRVSFLGFVGSWEPPVRRYASPSG